MVTNFRSVVIVSLGLAHRLSGLPPKTLEAIFSVLIWFVKQQPNMDVVVHVDPDADGVQKMLRTSYHKQPQEIKRRILLRPSIQQQKLMGNSHNIFLFLMQLESIID
jgi:hypothetical protein